MLHTWKNSLKKTASNPSRFIQNSPMDIAQIIPQVREHNDIAYELLSHVFWW